jgi:hypothetical protein
VSRSKVLAALLAGVACSSCGPVPRIPADDGLRLTASPVGHWRPGRDGTFVAIVTNHGRRPETFSVLRRPGWLTGRARLADGGTIGWGCTAPFGCSNTRRPEVYALEPGQAVAFTCEVDEPPAERLRVEVRLELVGPTYRELATRFDVPLR